MTLFLIVSIALFSVTIICIVLLVMSIDASRVGYGIYYKRSFFWICAVVALIAIILAIWSFTTYIHRVQNDAIEHYISGDYELVEEKINDQVVNSYYRLIKTDYD